VRRSPALLLGVAGGSVVLDQWAKVWATTNLAFREPLHVVGDLVTLTYTRNSGIAFGMFQGKSFPFYIFSIVAALAVFWLWLRHPGLSRWREWSLALILGGAVGNLIDRVRFGEVTDFILLAWRGHEFPVFNVADVCVTCGVILFALVWTHEPEPAHTASDTTADDAATVAGTGAPAHPAPEDPAHATDGSPVGAGSTGDGRGSAPGPVAGESPPRAES
jgi:signal peptidase II